MSYLKTAICHRGSCFICSSKGKLRTVNKESIVRAYNDFKIVIKPKSLHCSRHVDEKGVIRQDQFHHIRYSMKFCELKKPKTDIFEQFNDIDSLKDEICLKITGWTKTQFARFCKFITSILHTRNRSKEELVAIYRYWLKKGIDQTSLALLRSNSSQQQISEYLRTIRIAINKDFVPFFLGAGNRDRHFFIQHNHATVIELHKMAKDELAIFADATYCRIEKSADNQFQSETYSKQKLDLLIKPFIICCADGYFIDIYGPYPARCNDAVIFEHVLNSDNSLRDLLQKNKTLCFLDRGFRDIKIKLMNEYGFRVEMPYCSQAIRHCEKKPLCKQCKKEFPSSDVENYIRSEKGDNKKSKQLTTVQANNTRNVTKVRFIVECMNAFLKHNKALDNIRNTQVGHIQIDYRIAAAMLNFTHTPITPDKKNAKKIANSMNNRCKIKRNNLEFLLNKTVGTKNIPLIKIGDVKDFPRFKPSELINEIAFGTFQFKLVKSYLKDIINHGNPYKVSKNNLKEINNKNLRAELENNNRKIIAMEILPRHGRSTKNSLKVKDNEQKKINNKKLTKKFSKVYKAFVLYEPKINSVRGIKGYICSCYSGKRTNGCCVHVASIIYYFSYFIHKNRYQIIRHPADYLNLVLVDVKSNRTENFVPANNPQYIKNKRKLARETSSSSETDEESSISSPIDSEQDESITDQMSEIEVPDKSLDNKSITGAADNIEFNKSNTEAEIDQINQLILSATKKSLTEALQRKNDKKTKKKKVISILGGTVLPKGFLSERELREDEWLSDREIYAYLNKIREYLNANNIEFQGLNDPTVLTALRTDNLNMRQENFVEVLNSNNNHWVCVAAGLNIGDEDLCLFDSMSRREIDTQLGTTCSLITVLPRLEKGHLIFRIQKVSKQRATFCGYFALANAMALCLGLDPETLIYDENRLRDHYISIIYHNHPVAMFPYTVKHRTYKTSHSHLRFNLNDVRLTERQKINK